MMDTRTRPAYRSAGTSGEQPSEHQRRGVAQRTCLPHAEASPGERCHDTIPVGRRRCQRHERAYQAWRNARRGDGYGAEYQAERRRVLATAVVCALCHLPPTRRDPLTADHIVPRAHGGAARGNLRAVHRSCNSARGATVRSS